MQVIFTLLALLTLLPPPSFSLTILPPTDAASPRLSARGQVRYCYNGPTTVPGTTFSTRPDVEPERPTSDYLIWCTPNTQTYLNLLYARPLPGRHAWSTVQHVIDVANTLTRNQIRDGGDRVVTFGYWSHYEYGVGVTFQNTNNHQQTWGVLGAALVAIEGYLQMTQAAGADPGALKFDVYDGQNQVGNGTFGVGD